MKTWPICLPGPFKGCINRLFGDFQGCPKTTGLGRFMKVHGVFMWFSTVRFDSLGLCPRLRFDSGDPWHCAYSPTAAAGPLA